MLTIHSVAVDPSPVTSHATLPSGALGVLRPLNAADEARLAAFFTGLGGVSRGSYDVHDPRAHATEMCEAIDRYDKLRFVLEGPRAAILGVFEFSFGLPEADRDRYEEHGITLRPGTDVRFGMCLADELQGLGVATLLWPKLVEIARAFCCTRILLWGGVYASNTPARRFYRRAGFFEVGRFSRGDGQESVDMIVEC